MPHPAPTPDKQPAQPSQYDHRESVAESIAEETAAPTAVDYAVAQAETIDPGALALFHDEMRSGGATLSAALAAWQAPLSNDMSVRVQEAFANMRGVSLLLRIQPLAKMVKLCESAWQAARPTERAGNSVDVHCFSRSVELFQQLSNAVGTGYEEQVAAIQESLVAALSELDARASASSFASSAKKPSPTLPSPASDLKPMGATAVQPEQRDQQAATTTAAAKVPAATTVATPPATTTTGRIGR